MITAVYEKDWPLVADLVDPTLAKCSRVPTEQPLYVPCGDLQPAGTLVEVLPSGACEPFTIREDVVEEMLVEVLGDVDWLLYGVAEAEATSGPGGPPGPIGSVFVGIVFGTDEPFAVTYPTFWLNDSGRIQVINFGCGSVESVMPVSASWLFPAVS